MAQQVTVTARGLFVGQNALGAVPDGALSQADNCVISKDGIVETRRGLASVATKSIARFLPYKSYLVGWAATGVLSRSSDNGATWADYSGTYAVPGSPIHSAEMNGNLYFTTGSGIQRLDSLTGTPEPAGMPGGLDVQAALGAAGTAVPPNNQVAYRIVWGKRDANGTLILGAPSGRGTVTQPAPYVIAIGNLVRATNVVTATLSAGVTNVFKVGESVTLSPGEANFAAGVKTLTAVTATTFSYAETAANATSTVAQTFTGPSRDISVTASIPRNLPTGAFYQVYRSPNSGLEAQTPEDNLGLVYEGTPPLSSTLTTLARASGTTVTATTSAAHGYSPGMIVRVPSSAGTGLFVVVGTPVANVGGALSSPDGTNWTVRNMPGSAAFQAVVWNGSVFCATGTSAAGVGGGATSPDGITWTGRNLPGTDTFYGVAWSGTQFCAVGQTAGGSGGAATSPTGVTWTSQIISGTAQYRAIAWSGTVFAAVGDSAACSTSPDGVTWTNRTIPAGNYKGVVWDGAQFVAVGSVVATSPDGITWTQRQSLASAPATAVAWNGTVYFATASFAGTQALGWSSPDAITWVLRAGTSNFGKTGVVWSGAQFLLVGPAAGSSTDLANSVDGVRWNTVGHASTGYSAPAFSGTVFGSGERAVLTTPTGTSFTYTEWGNNGTVGSLSQALVPLTAGFTDSIPSGFIGAALYTNPNEGTIQAAAARISMCQDIVAFRGYMFAGNVTHPSRASIYLLGVGGTGGIASGDSITIDGIPYTANAASESVTNGTFIAYTNGTPAQNIANTVASLLRIINRTLSNTITGIYLSGANDVPGLFYLEENGTATTMTVTFSRPTAWSIQSLKAPENRKSEIRWSSANQPDAWPLLNNQQLGSIDKPVKRVLATRDMLVVVKDDGLWRVTGFGGVWDMQPLDPTQGSPAPESMVAFENTIYGVLDSGVVRITEGGVQSIAVPIYPVLEPLLATAALATTADTTFGIAYHSAHKYILWLPSAAGDTVAKQALVYDSWTQAWTRWLPPTGVTGWKHGIINNPSVDDRMLLGDGTSIYREKKAMDDTDFQDATNTPIPATVKYLPKFGGNPGRMWHFQEIALAFKRVKFGTGSASVSFSTNVSPAEETVPLLGTDYGIDTTAGSQTTIRALIPLEKARGSQLNVKFSHAEAGSPFQLEGLSVVYRPGSTRVGK